MEPTSALSFEDLILRVAREAGISYHGSSGNERAMIPIDEHDLDLCKTIVNDGIRMFVADAPPKGWRWMRRIMSVTLTATRVTGTADSASTTTVVDSDLVLTPAAGTADSASDTTLVDAALSATYGTDNDLKDYYCYIISGTGAGSFAKITGYNASNGTITVADWLTSAGAAGGTNPDTGSTFGISSYKILIGYYCYIVTGTGKNSWAVITGYNASNGTITVVDWLDAYGNPGGTDPAASSTFAITPVETVGGDIHRYPLAENFGGEVNGEIHYASDTNHASIIYWRDEAYIRARRAITVITGYPQYAAIRPLEFYAGGTGPKRRWELIVNPNPVAADVLEFPHTLFFDELQLIAGDASSVNGSTGLLDTALDNLYPDDYFNGWAIKIISGTGKNSYALVDDYTGGTAQFDVLDWLSISGAAGGTDPAANSVYVVTPPGNLHPAGLRFDEAIKAACLAQAEIEIEDVSAGFTQKYIQQALQKAYAIDTRSAPRKLGSMNIGERHARERTWLDISYD